ncbi:hypothetical protein AB1Y20_015403 [Prymnesium parvum]|uniref:Cell division cycle protein 123 homolog n=1 Tax=Prymnesium parvum TaxID=97485 RepID=A0AB34K0M8_PRYPA
MSARMGAASAALEQCSFDRWYPALRRVSIKSIVVPLSHEFVAHLLADGVFVHDSASSDGSDDNGSVAASAARPRFPEVEQKITDAIAELGGAVFPKLNWSAPKDAAWLLGGNLKCVSAKDVITLLQSSDHIAHDICDARPACASVPSEGDPEFPAPTYSWRNHSWVLVLRKWSNLRTSNEFRCFSVGGRLIAASQRDRYGHYEFLVPMREAILHRLSQFSLQHLVNMAVVPHAVVWDAYMESHTQKVYLLDLAPFHESVDPILFDWPTLRRIAENQTSAAGHSSLDASVAADNHVPGSTFLAAAALRAADAGVIRPCDAGAADDSAVELRLVDEQGLAPTSQMYYGVPHDLRETGDIASLIANARNALSEQVEEHEPTGSESESLEAPIE